MPRGKAIKRSLDEQITILEEDIRIAQNKLNKLQNKWKYIAKSQDSIRREIFIVLSSEGEWPKCFL